jgi:hypothetical protein
VPSSKPLPRRRFQPGDNYLAEDLQKRSAGPADIKYLRIKERMGEQDHLQQAVGERTGRIL